MERFDDMSLHQDLLKSLKKLKFYNPTDIQKKVLPLIKTRKDLIACAETGSGKTGAFGIPIVNALYKDPGSRLLVLVPTRELGKQMADFFRELVSGSNKLHVSSLVGGSDIRKQVRALKRKPQVVIATPGRLLDHLSQGSAHLKNVKYLVLDEGDRMLDMGFEPQLNAILEHLPEKRQTCLFSATFPKKVERLANKYLNAPQRVDVGAVSQPVEAVKQSVLLVDIKQKEEALLDELIQRKGSIIVFTRTKRRTDLLAQYLQEYAFAVEPIHGDRTQGQRNAAIRNFKSGKARILVATDVAARGIDIPQVEHVINYELPQMDEDYVHRVGRTARNGATGEAVTFVSPQDKREWKSIVRKYRLKDLDIDSNEAYESQDSQDSGEDRGRKLRENRQERQRDNSGYGGRNERSSKGRGRRGEQEDRGRSSRGSERSKSRSKGSSDGAYDDFDNFRQSKKRNGRQAFFESRDSGKRSSGGNRADRRGSMRDEWESNNKASSKKSKPSRRGASTYNERRSSQKSGAGRKSSSGRSSQKGW